MEIVNITQTLKLLIILSLINAIRFEYYLRDWPIFHSSTHISVLVDAVIVGQFNTVERDGSLHQLINAERSVRMPIRPYRLGPRWHLCSIDRCPVWDHPRWTMIRVSIAAPVNRKYIQYDVIATVGIIVVVQSRQPHPQRWKHASKIVQNICMCQLQHVTGHGHKRTSTVFLIYLMFFVSLTQPDTKVS